MGDIHGNHSLSIQGLLVILIGIDDNTIIRPPEPDVQSGRRPSRSPTMARPP
ncbi:hypothetical protein KNP414_05595 [Paenibacillus mucilaginosus KNP414]|uniref:Uncharacterized protein n=1 Tax=Paenibacillus mucilaginosus (strain KNP414) TaxID=1036673 RepID=F8FLJ2_PAEMK|nr:hypothetical protein KNP414_05595 [Paenibacillus mucilaginosus KNP414]